MGLPDGTEVRRVAAARSLTEQFLMAHWLERALLLVSDFLAINAATVVLLWMKFVGGGLTTVEKSWRLSHHDLASEPTFSYALKFYTDEALPLIFLCWLVLFIFLGMYRIERTQSRLDEVIAVFKVVTLGTLLFLIATMDSGVSFTRVLMGTYWLSLLGLVGGGRVALRSVQRRLIAAGVGRTRAVIVGADARGERLLEDLRLSPEQGYEVAGFVRARTGEKREEVAGLPLLGDIEQLADIIAEQNVETVLIALKSNTHAEVVEIVEAARGQAVSFSITPDLYDIVAGHVRTQQIYGVPLMELNPQIMPPWEQAAKRLTDVAVSLTILVGLSPLWALIAVAIKVESKGPILFRQERVGRDGVTFTMSKFRSMREGAEDRTGPTWVESDDPRVTRVGRLLRGLHLDEVPQCLNFLKGDMSLVGPRPERPYFVQQFARQIPFYMRRFNVKPGLLGWAQSKHEFDLSSKDLVRIARERLEYDLYYIENSSLALDLKIMLRTIWFVLAGKSTR